LFSSQLIFLAENHTQEMHMESAKNTLSTAVHVERSVTIDRPADELYRFWRSFDKLPLIVNGLRSVKIEDENHSYWAVEGPMGTTMEWRSRITEDIPGEVISWETAGDADVPSIGRVQFKTAPGGRGTEVTVAFNYDPPGGKVGQAIATLFGDNPSQYLREALQKFKQLMETGEIATVAGQ
jgi:uncharacterized membrane protein